MIRIRDTQEKLICDCGHELEPEDVAMVKHIVSATEKNRVIMNMEKVSSVKNNTLTLLKEISEQNKLSLCNLDADIFAVLNLLNYDDYFSIYPCEESCIEDKFELKNRRFKIV